MKQILGFRGKYRWLSNFPDCPIEWGGILYPSPENAYQAAKSLDPEVRKKFLGIKSAEAKKLGRKIDIRPDWHSISLATMTAIQRLKYAQEPFRSKLIATGDAYIEETNTWNDTFWGGV